MSVTNGSQSVPRNRHYVVLEETPLKPVVQAVLAAAGVELSDEQAAAVDDAADGAMPTSVIYRELTRLPSRNAAHALTQIGRTYDVGVTPPLVAVSERMFRPQSVTVEPGDTRVSIG